MKRETIEIQKEMFSQDSSSMQKYCALVVGQRGLGALLKYELITSHSCIPGALGLFLRSKLFPCLFRDCGRGVTFGQNVVLRHPHKISIGDNVVIDDNCVLDAKGTDNEGIRIGSGVFIGRNSILSCKNGDITLADNVNIGFNCEVFSASQVVLGKSSLVAAYCYFIGGGHDYDDPTTSVLDQGRNSIGIQAGEGSWFGAGAKILDGVNIGAHAIVGANSVVTRDVPDYAVAAGTPAEVKRDRRDAGAPPSDE
jgi:acetyltransferase-like isoleucine patch superfamily enzyme